MTVAATGPHHGTVLNASPPQVNDDRRSERYGKGDPSARRGSLHHREPRFFYGAFPPWSEPMTEPDCPAREARA